MSEKGLYVGSITRNYSNPLGEGFWNSRNIFQSFEIKFYPGVVCRGPDLSGIRQKLGGWALWNSGFAPWNHYSSGVFP